MRWQWRTDKPGAPWVNMAVDEALFAAVRDGVSSTPIVRVYTWDRPSVSIGRLQDADAVEETFPGLPWVRRPTGGRAVLHGDDITLTVVTRSEWMPPSHAKGVLSSYRQIVGGVIAALRGQGLDARMGVSGIKSRSHDVDCFASVADCDVADRRSGHKLVGSAQRREGGAILQQMSVPVAVLTDHQTFLRDAKSHMQEALVVDGWDAIDTGFAL